MAKSLFVSYSHKDETYVTPVVYLLRGAVNFVFHDRTNIRPGNNWRQVIDEALLNCDLFVLFWCAHAKNSREVKAEYEKAISSQKQLMPVLLDSTPLPDALSRYQWADFRKLAYWGHLSARAGLRRAIPNLDGLHPVLACLVRPLFRRYRRNPAVITEHDSINPYKKEANLEILDEINAAAFLLDAIEHRGIFDHRHVVETIRTLLFSPEVF
jgi:hypothetical protein